MKRQSITTTSIITLFFVCFSIVKAYAGFGDDLGDNSRLGPKAQATVEFSSNKSSYLTGEIIKLKAEFSGEGLVDLYLMANFPDNDGDAPYIQKIDEIPLLAEAGHELGATETREYNILVAPILPEGDYAITFIIVDADTSPLIQEKWVASDEADFHITQLMEPVVNVELGHLTVPLQNGGSIDITFNSGEISGTITIVTEDGQVIVREVSGYYEVDVRDKKITIYMEGEAGIGGEIIIQAEDNLLKATVTTNRGATGEVTYNRETQEVEYNLDHQSIQEIMEAMDVSWYVEEGALFVTVTTENPDNSTTETTYKGTWEMEDKSLVLHVENIDEEGQSVDITITPNLDGTMTISWETSSGISGSKTYETRIDPRNYDPDTMTWSKEIKERGSFSIILTGENRITIKVALCDESGEFCVDKSMVVEYSLEDDSLFIQGTTEEGRTGNATITKEDDGDITVDYSTDAGYEGSHTFNTSEIDVNIDTDELDDMERPEVPEVDLPEAQVPDATSGIETPDLEQPQVDGIEGNVPDVEAPEIPATSNTMDELPTASQSLGGLR